jgi:glycosyltransferase involved in cell wall biosynthesis
VDIDEMVRHLQRWIERPGEWQELSDNCRQYGQNNFSIETIAGRLEQAIGSVL